MIYKLNLSVAAYIFTLSGLYAYITHIMYADYSSRYFLCPIEI